MGWPKGKPRPASTRAKISAARKKALADPEFAAKHAERMRKLHADPEFAAKLSQAREERLKRSCFHCGAKYRLVPLDGIDGEFECGDERACEKRIQANLRGVA